MASGIVLRDIRVASPDTGAVEMRDLTLMSGSDRAVRHEVRSRGDTVLPALVNAHDHLHLNCIPSLPAGQLFPNSYAWSAAYQAQFEQAAIRQARRIPAGLRHWQGALKNALCGATTVMHHDPIPPGLDRPGFPARVVQPYGWAHSLHLKYGPPVVESFRATAPDVGWFIHLGEGVDELAADELNQLKALECLGANTVLIHGVALSESDTASVIAAGAAVVWCPSSNLSILGKTIGRPQLRALFDAGRLTLGTDSRLSGAFDLLEELRIAARHSDFSPRELLRLVTDHARRLLRAPAVHDDIIILPSVSGDPFSDALKLRRHELRAVVRDGRPLIADPDFEDWFHLSGVAAVRIELDGHPKLCARDLLMCGDDSPLRLEPGFGPATLAA